MDLDLDPLSVSITYVVLLPEFATYIFVPAELTAIPIGPFPTFTVAVTMFVAVSITETLLLYVFTTYTFVPSCLTATSQGPIPTFTVAVTLFVAVSCLLYTSPSPRDRQKSR